MEGSKRKAMLDIVPFLDRCNQEDTYFNDYRAKFYGHSVPLVIDSGSHQCKAGWGSEDNPRMVFRCVVAKTRPRREGEPSILVGNDMKETDIAKLQPRTAFDQNIVYNFELQEHVFDHVFQHLGINDTKVDHPIFMTEPTCNPNYCRKNITELLIEGYNVPSVCYGIDSLFSFYNNHKHIQGWPHADALVISSGHSATHIHPIVNGVHIASKVKRLSVGGSVGTDFMRKLVHLKYPWHRNFITQTRAQYLKEDHCIMSQDYAAELALFSKPDQGNDIRIQLPFTPQPVPQKQDLERKAQTKKEQGNRLKELNERRKKEKMQEQEERLAALFELKTLQQTLPPNEFNEQLEAYGLLSVTELALSISDLEEALGRAPTQPPVAEEQLYPLLDIPDSELTDEQQKEKKRQKFLKSTREGRATAKRKRDQLQQDLDMAKQQEEDKYQKDPQQYTAQLHDRRKLYLERREARRKKRAQLASGGKRYAASQQRLKLLTQLEADERKGGKKKHEDNFGADDKDWNVYLGESDPEGEEDEAQLQHIESLLVKYDTSFTGAEESLIPVMTEQVANQIHLGIERFRVPEMLYQPHSIVGVEQMGLTEAIQSILSTFETKTQDRMVMNIYYTGGNTLFSGFHERLEKEIMQIRPVGSPFRIVPPIDCSMDAWRGMSLYYRENIDTFRAACVTKAEYEEFGGEYLKPYFASNIPY